MEEQSERGKLELIRSAEKKLGPCMEGVAWVKRHDQGEYVGEERLAGVSWGKN